MAISKVRVIHGIAASLLFFMSMVLACACRQDSTTKATTVPIDTTIVDDDTLEVNNTPTPAARAR